MKTGSADSGKFLDGQEIEEAQGQIQARMRQAARLQARSNCTNQGAHGGAKTI